MIKTNLRESYKEYSSQDDAVDLKTYLLVTADYNKYLISKVLEGHEVTLPARMGFLYILGKKQNIRFDEQGNVVGLAPDWVKTKALWERDEDARVKKKRLFHLNANTDNTRYKYLWSKNRVLVENKTLYALRMTRANKRAVHQVIKQGKKYITR